MATSLSIVILVGLTGLLYAAEKQEQPATRPVGATTRPATQPATQPTTQPAKPRVEIQTNFGRIVVELEPERTPATVKNFLTYVDERFYDGLLFHRVMQRFMIQGGGFTTEGRYKQPTHPPVRNESRDGLSNTRGTIAMARTTDPNSATTQFFINTVDNSRLDDAGGGYTAFGRVVEGMDVVDKIASVPVRPGPLSDEAQPTENVVIRSIRRK